jgi:hypothetical protein
LHLIAWIAAMAASSPHVLLVSTLLTRREHWARLMRLCCPEAEIVFAHDGASASYQSNRRSFSIAVIDIDLPDMSHGLTAKLRASLATLPIMPVRHTAESHCADTPSACETNSAKTTTLTKSLPDIFNCRCLENVATPINEPESGLLSDNVGYVGVMRS